MLGGLPPLNPLLTPAPGSKGLTSGAAASSAAPLPGAPLPLPKPGAPPLPGAPVTTDQKIAALGQTPGKPTPPPAGLPPAPPLSPLPGAAAVTPAAASAAVAPGATPGAATSAGGGAKSTPPLIQPVAAARNWLSPKFLLIGLGALLLIGVVGFVASRFLGGSNQPASVNTSSQTTGQTDQKATSAQQKTLTYWGLWEASDVFDSVLRDFDKANPGVKVAYQKQSYPDYRERLQTAIASQNGPDVFRFHASWTPMLREELAPMPTSIMSLSDYQKTFYPVAAQQLQINGQIVGIPLMYDGLGLYYNKDILRVAGAQPPKTWAELKSLAAQLTVRNGEAIERGGLAIGNATNVEHFSDILGLLILQNGGDPAQPTSKEVTEAIAFYTNFVRIDKVWSTSLPSSTVAFARGDVAMMLAPSWRAHEVKATNPNLQFGIAPVPKLGDSKIAWASYWAEGVNHTRAWI